MQLASRDDTVGAVTGRAAGPLGPLAVAVFSDRFQTTDSRRFQTMISVRQIVVIIAVGVGLWLLKRLQSRVMDRLAGDGDKPPRRSAPADDVQETVRCQRCGSYLARSQASGSDAHGYRCRDGCDARA